MSLQRSFLEQRLVYHAPGLRQWSLGPHASLHASACVGRVEWSLTIDGGPVIFLEVSQVRSIVRGVEPPSKERSR